MILNNIWIQIRIIIQHQQNVSKVFQLLIPDDGYWLNDMLVPVIDPPLKMLYLSSHVIHETLLQSKNKIQKLHLK